jgi:glycosyltransferase involved in cell wall biosynthesis
MGCGAHLTWIDNPSDVVRNLLYDASDVFVSPVDNIQESFGLSIIEAMAHGLPVIASDWSGYRDIVRHGVSGFLIPTYWDGAIVEAVSNLAPMDAAYGGAAMIAKQTVVDVPQLYRAVCALVTDADLRHRMGAAGRAIAETDYSW